MVPKVDLVVNHQVSLNLTIEDLFMLDDLLSYRPLGYGQSQDEVELRGRIRYLHQWAVAEQWDRRSKRIPLDHPVDRIEFQRGVTDV